MQINAHYGRQMSQVLGGVAGDKYWDVSALKCKARIEQILFIQQWEL